jgi:hypothetical protein
MSASIAKALEKEITEQRQWKLTCNTLCKGIQFIEEIEQILPPLLDDTAKINRRGNKASIKTKMKIDRIHLHRAVICVLEMFANAA